VQEPGNRRLQGRREREDVLVKKKPGRLGRGLPQPRDGYGIVGVAGKKNRNTLLGKGEGWLVGGKRRRTVGGIPEQQHRLKGTKGGGV